MVIRCTADVALLEEGLPESTAIDDCSVSVRKEREARLRAG